MYRVVVILVSLCFFISGVAVAQNVATSAAGAQAKNKITAAQIETLARGLATNFGLPKTARIVSQPTLVVSKSLLMPTPPFWTVTIEQFKIEVEESTGIVSRVTNVDAGNRQRERAHKYIGKSDAEITSFIKTKISDTKSLVANAEYAKKQIWTNASEFNAPVETSEKEKGKPNETLSLSWKRTFKDVPYYRQKIQAEVDSYTGEILTIDIISLVSTPTPYTERINDKQAIAIAQKKIKELRPNMNFIFVECKKYVVGKNNFWKNNNSPSQLEGTRVAWVVEESFDNTGIHIMVAVDISTGELIAGDWLDGRTSPSKPVFPL
jgi:Zn-dependent metalloprotease